MMAEAILVHLGLGSNLGDRNEFLSRACKLCVLRLLGNFVHHQFMKVSRF